MPACDEGIYRIILVEIGPTPLVLGQNVRVEVNVAVALFVDRHRAGIALDPLPASARARVAAAALWLPVL